MFTETVRPYDLALSKVSRYLGVPKRWEMFDRDGVARLLKEHQDGSHDHSYLLFSLLMLSFPAKSM